MLNNDEAIKVVDVSKKYKLGQVSYRTLRDDIARLFKGTKKKDGHFWALKNVSFGLKEGESLGIIGANGSGKSTMLKMLAGVTNPTSGTVEKKGRIGALIELTAGFHSELTGRENIYLYGSIIGMKRSDINKRFDEIVEFSGLSDFLDTPIKRYSSGMYARLGFSVTAHLDPDILLIDEVLSVGDFSFQNKCLDKMLEYKKRKVSIVFVSHNLDSVRKICNRALFLEKGELIYDGDIEDAINEYYFSFSKSKAGTNDILPTISLTDKKMVNSIGNSCGAINSGDLVDLKLKFKAENEIKNVCFAMFVRHSNGMVIFDTSSDLINGQKYEFRAGEEKTLKFSLSVNLLKGAYLIGCNVYRTNEQNSVEYLFYENNLFAFTVKENVAHQGVVNLNAKCILE